MSTEFTEEELNQFSKKILIKMLMANTEQLKQVQEQLKLLTEQVNLLTQNRFGRHNEKKEETGGDCYQMKFCFNEAEITIQEAPAESLKEPEYEEVHPSSYKRSKKKGKREADLKDFPVVRIDHELTSSQLICGCGHQMEEFHEEVYRKLRFYPARFEVEEHHVKVYSCSHCDGIRRADRPVSVIPNSIATPSLIAGILNAKYINSIPLYRLEQEFIRYDVHISRQVMANWAILCAERYLGLLYDRMKTELLRSDLIHADETYLTVSKDGRPAGSKSYMWVYYKGDADGKPVVLYEYQTTREAIHPEEFLKDYHGYLCCDGYQAYHKLNEDITVCGCYAHARRHFVNAEKALKKCPDRNVEQSISSQALDRIGLFFHLDNQWKGLPPEEHTAKRQTVLRPLVEDFISWIRSQKGKVPPKSETGKGINYILNQERYLVAFLEDGRIPLDNSAAERAIRSFTVGRKNFVLIDTIKGAQASAVLYSIAETAKANALRPYQYFEYLLEKIPKHMEDTSLDFLEELLPWSDQLPQSIRKTES